MEYVRAERKGLNNRLRPAWRFPWPIGIQRGSAGPPAINCPLYRNVGGPRSAHPLLLPPVSPLVAPRIAMETTIGEMIGWTIDHFKFFLFWDCEREERPFTSVEQEQFHSVFERVCVRVKAHRYLCLIFAFFCEETRFDMAIVSSSSLTIVLKVFSPCTTLAQSHR